MNHDGEEFVFRQQILDPCVFMLVPSKAPDPPPKACLGVHVDDLLLVGGRRLSQAIEDALSAVLPIDEWERNDFELGATTVSTSQNQLMQQVASFR